MDNCTYSSKVGAFHDRQLSVSEIREVESHLAVCRECSQSLRELQKVSALVSRSVPQVSPAPTLARLRDLRRRQERTDLLPVARLLTAVASVLLLLSGGLLALTQSDSSTLPSGTPVWVEVATTREVDAEFMEEPEVVLTQWVVAGLSEGNGR